MSRANLLVLVVLLPLIAAGPATKPSKPTTKPAAPAGDLLSVGDGMYEFHAPPGDWKVVPTDHPGTDLLALVHGHGDGQIQVLMEPKDMQLRQETNGIMAVKIAQTLLKQHQADGTVMVLKPTVVRDKRFDLAVHEKLKVGDSVMDEMHLYRSLGPRTIAITIGSLSADPAAVAKCLADGEALAAAITYNRKAFKK